MNYESNINQVVIDLQGKLKKASDVSVLQREVATYLKASNLRRIHNDGVSVSGGSIGNYNTTHPLYVNPKYSPRQFPVKGKGGKTRFNNDKAHKTGYFSSYSDFRKAVGRETGKVNLQLSGLLFKSWGMEQNGKDWLIGFTNPYGSKVAAGNENHFGKLIWGVTANDNVMIDKIINEHANKALNATS